MMALARSVNKADPKRTIQILRDAVVVAGDQSGLEYAELFNDLSVLLAENGLADEALRYSRKAYNVARKKK